MEWNEEEASKVMENLKVIGTNINDDLRVLLKSYKKKDNLNESARIEGYLERHSA